MYSFTVCTIIGTMGTSDYLFVDRQFHFRLYAISLQFSLCKVGSLQFRQILSWRVATSTPQSS